MGPHVQVVKLGCSGAHLCPLLSPPLVVLPGRDYHPVTQAQAWHLHPFGHWAAWHFKSVCRGQSHFPVGVTVSGLLCPFRPFSGSGRALAWSDRHRSFPLLY